MLQFSQRESIIWNAPFSPAEKLVLLALNSYADGEGRNCFPSYQTIASKTGYNRRTVIRIVNGLEKSGIVTHRARADEGGRQTSNTYRICYKAIVGVTEDHPKTPLRGDRGSLGGVTEDHWGGDRGSPDQSIDQSKGSVCIGGEEKQPITHAEKIENSPLSEKAELGGEEIRRSVSSAAANFQNVPPVAEETWLEAFNSSRAPQWLPLGIGCLSGPILEGVLNFIQVAGSEEEGVEALKLAARYAAKNEQWLASRKLRPAQLLDPSSKTFLGQFREASRTQEPAQPEQPECGGETLQDRISKAINPLSGWEVAL